MSAGDSLGRYVVVQPLGQGGMGQTYLCVRQGTHGVEQRVCAKVVSPALRGREESVALFRREAFLAASLRHPGIAGVLDVDDGQGLIVYEYVDGCDLRTLLSGGPLEPELVVFILMQVSQALEYAHNRRFRGRCSPVIHRDISPSNLMADRHGHVKLIDFGIAKSFQDPVHQTTQPQVKGKLPYMSPEQALASELDGRSDQFSLGVVAYELIAGARPHDGKDDMDTWARVISSKHVPIARRMPSIPAGLAEVIERMLAVDPDKRFASMTTVIDALAPFTPSHLTYRTLAARVNAIQDPYTIGSEGGMPVSVPVAPSAPASGSVHGLGSSRSRRGDEHVAASEAGHEAGARDNRRSTESGTPFQFDLAGPIESGTADASMLARLERLLAAGAARWSLLVAVASLSLALGAGTSWFARNGAVSDRGVVPAAEGPPADSGLDMTSGSAPPLPEFGPLETAVHKTGGGGGAETTSTDTASGGDTDWASGPLDGYRAPLTPTGRIPTEVAGFPGGNSGGTAVQPPKPSRPHSGPEARPRPRAKGRLKVGVFPNGNVWVDGRLQGRAPISLDLPVGRHTIGIGNDRPVRKSRVIVTKGQDEAIVVNLSGGDLTPFHQP